ncbi:N-acetylmuramoyl-L-alanine amidase family protein [Henriciella aquimarina]|uniref:N-acetylmuramoyl-L-alanine amidase family protein n=1 Tax=Henriciella aquimarina TaxID=545261 RepID=UPI000A0234BF|nr:N-acetylmuramoyl-L-alanine amidase [Henriciella aquimarina]
MLRKRVGKMVSGLIRKTALFAACLWVAGFAYAAEISEIAVTGDSEYTRIMIAGDDALDHEAFLVSGEGRRQVDLKLTGSRVALNAETPAPQGAIDAYEIRNGEILFSLTTPMMVSRALSLSPTTAEPRHRLVIDLVRVAPIRFDKAAARDTAARTSYAAIHEIKPEPGQGRGTELGKRPDEYVVVIDPGHGGRDPGASSHNGKREKAIVLAASLELKRVLERSGRYKVHLTREDDRYIEHEDRVSMARNWGADLFISVHADAAANSGVSGATVYTLSARGERRVDRTAMSNGWDMPIEDGTSQEVSGILADLIKRETKSNSSIFADLLTPELAKAGPVVRNSHREENFFVLLAPDVPAVLLEIGFLTNRSDVARLSSESGRRKMAEAVGRAIDRYFDRRDMLYAAN